MSRSLRSFSPRALVARILAILAMVVTLFGIATPAAASCVGHCPTGGQPAFTVHVMGGGHVVGANHAMTGPGGTSSVQSQTQDFLRLELNLTAAGNPNGLCGDGCVANNLTATMAAGVLATGLATHQVSGQGNLTASTSSGSSADLRLFGQGIWSTLPAQTP